MGNSFVSINIRFLTFIFLRLGIPIMLFVFPKTNRHFVKSTQLREFQLSASYCDRGLSLEACKTENRLDEMTSACLSLIVLQIANIPNIIHAKPFPAQRPSCLLLVYFVSAAGCHCFDLWTQKKKITKNQNVMLSLEMCHQG